MAITLQQGTAAMLGEVIDAVASWQHDRLPIQVHPGDLGWNSSSGAQAITDSLRVWRSDGQIVAAGMVDDASALIRLAIAPGMDHDEELAARLLEDISRPDRGVLPAGRGLVEARFGQALRDLLRRRGWEDDAPWTPLSRRLTNPVEDCGLRIATVNAVHQPDLIVQDRVSVQRASFPGSTFTLKRWQAMTASPAYRDAACLVAYDAEDNAVAATTVWSAGQGRPGLIEPLGVDSAHRGRGHGRAITVAAAAALRVMGASSATVCTPASNGVGVAAYVSAGFERLPDVTDFRRPA